MARRRGLAEAKIIGIVSICQRVVYQKERPEADWPRGVNTVRGGFHEDTKERKGLGTSPFGLTASLPCPSLAFPCFLGKSPDFAVGQGVALPPR